MRLKSVLIVLAVMLIFSGSAMASLDTLTVQTLAYTGITPSFTAVGGDTVYVPNNGYTLVEVKNASGAEITVTVDSQMESEEGRAATDNAVTVAATTGDKIIGPLLQKAWNVTSSGYAVFIFSATADVTIAAYKINR